MGGATLKKVQVLISTYNGEKFLAEQLDSILNQTYSNIIIYIRDDGSTDATAAIVQKYISKYEDKIRYIQGENIGVVKSFISLLLTSSTDADIYCFCDQDDVWFPDKVERAVLKLQEFQETPAMIFTTTQLTDSNLKCLKLWPSNLSKEPSFYNAIIQNIVVGATITLNKHARDLLCKKTPDTTQIIMHDWWVYLCISAFGETLFDSTPSIYYRQHTNNLIGGETSILDYIRRKINSFKKNRGSRLLYKQALEFHRLYKYDLDDTKRIELELFLKERKSIHQKIRYLSKSKLFRQSSTETFLYKLLVFIGHL